MKCLICDKELSNGAGLFNLIFNDDLICYKCRSSLCYNPIDLTIDNYGCHSLFIYDENFSSFLLQYKECYDEAIAPVFLYPYLAKLKKKYRGYTIVLAPSSDENLKRRGFNHLKKIFESLKIPIIDCLYKDQNVSQNNLSFDERANIKSHIRCIEINLPDKILLVDDVLTSGSTVSGCINCLKDKTKELKVLTIAYNKHYLKP